MSTEFAKLPYLRFGDGVEMTTPGQKAAKARAKAKRRAKGKRDLLLLFIGWVIGVFTVGLIMLQTGALKVHDNTPPVVAVVHQSNGQPLYVVQQ